jgi:hypothetical protein
MRWGLVAPAYGLGNRERGRESLSIGVGFRFNDGYFRGYRDRGNEGYEVLEIVPDFTDIMCTPAFGKAQRFHFDLFLSQLRTASGRTQ